ncbi:MAG: 2-C-methyl-D-erythritol 4-phosphate cytidylyltransferase, partial [Bacteroidia bacterium]|nr:2-C-methyl-D-erythritol 4-phosphate cytidylyltransferase [Bacteroidia bacterium]
VAGGRGVRMGTDVPKQFLLLADKPVLMHCIEAFRMAYPDTRVVVVLPEGQQKTWMDLCNQYQFNEPHTLVTGGNTRYQSVKNALYTIAGPGLVAVHDGVRPLIHPETIRRLFDEAAIHSNAIPVISSKDSLRWDDEHGNRVIDRNLVKLIQTPQMFELNKLKAAYVQDYEDAFTDDATVWEKAGNLVHLVEGQADNIKITTKDDLVVAEALLQGRHQ